jgi:hypothetical protein
VLTKLKQLVSSKKFLYVLLAIFLAQAIFFAVDFDYGVPSDEAYHVGIIQIYADRPLAASPIIAHQTDRFDLGDIQRLPTYLFHYSLSIVMRLTRAFTSNFDVQVLVLRFVNVLFGFLAMLVLVRLFRRLGQAQLTINLLIAWLVVTGMWVWVFAGINYDSLAMLLYFLTLDQLVALVQKPAVQPALWSMICGMALLLTKATYQPIVALSFLAAVGWLTMRHNAADNWRKVVKSWQTSWRTKAGRWGLVGVVLLTVLLGGMVLERYGQNYLRYGKATPICDQIHTVEQCKQNAIYDRNSGQKREFETFKQNGGHLFFTPWGFTARWIKTMFERTYFFWGHRTLSPSLASYIVGGTTALVCLLACGLAFAYGFRMSPLQTGVVILALIYFVMVFGYNLSVYLDEGYPFAFQGRYLLPALPMLYITIVQCGQFLYQRWRKRGRSLVTVVVALLVILNLGLHTPVIIYWRNRQNLRLPPDVQVLQTPRWLA